MIHVGLLIAAIASFILFIGLIILVSCDDTTNDGDVLAGVIITVAFILTVLFGCAVPKTKPFYDRYKVNVEDVKEFRIDTTFTSTNGVTDTTYTIFYNKIEEDK